MDDRPIANLNNFRQLIGIIGRRPFYKAITNNVSIPVDLKDYKPQAHSECFVIIFGTYWKYLYYSEAQKYNLIADDAALKTLLNIFCTKIAFKIINPIKKIEHNSKALKAGSPIRSNGGSPLF